MKRYFIIILAALCALALMCACAVEPAPVQTVGGADVAAPSDTEDTALPADEAPLMSDEAKKALATLLGSVYADYHAGTAGCTLVAARLAGMLLDCDADYAFPPEGAKAVAAEYTLTLDPAPEGMQTFAEQLADVYAQALLLCGENADAILDSCGYERRAEAWDADGTAELFDALLEGAE